VVTLGQKSLPTKVLTNGLGFRVSVTSSVAVPHDGDALLFAVIRKVTLPPFIAAPLICTLVVSEFGLTILTVKPAGLPPGAIDHAGTARTALFKLLPVTLNVFVPKEPSETFTARHCAAGSAPALTVGG
jgi:hypothetical protein